jgi:uncharacterized protein
MHFTLIPIESSAKAMGPARPSTGQPGGGIIDALFQQAVEHFDAGLAAWTVACVLLAGVLRGYSGFGFALAAMPLLSLVALPTTAVPLVQLLNVLIGFGRPHELRHHTDRGSLKRLVPGAVIGTPIGALALAALPADVIRLAAGLAVSAAILLLYRRPTHARTETASRTLWLGLLSGLLNGSVAMAGPPAIFHFMSLRLPAITVRASLIAFFFATSVLGAVMMGAEGLVSANLLLAAAALWLPLHIGNRFGACLFRRSSERLYRRITLIALIGTAVGAIARALVGLVG